MTKCKYDAHTVDGTEVYASRCCMLPTSFFGCVTLCLVVQMALMAKKWKNRSKEETTSSRVSYG